jgi:2-polyprenyl-6-methoxyphenol hydroxylase-like FAD-dependent oxidoreductase
MDVSGEEIYNEWVEILTRLCDGPLPKKSSRVCSVCVLQQHRGLTTSEIVSINQLDFEQAQQELANEYSRGLVIKEQRPLFDYWSMNTTNYAINKNGFKIKDATIIGGGVAGHFLALMLKRNNIPYKLFEKSDRSAPGGLGFLLVENGLEALRLMGLKNQILKNSNTLNFFKAIDTKGNVIYKRILEECVAISRDTFFKVVGDELDAAHHVHGKAAVSIIKAEDGQTNGVLLDDGSTIQSDVYFALDGINSVVRQQLFPDNVLEEVMEGELVCMVTIKDTGLQQDEFLKIFDKEHGKFMGLIPLGNDQYIWFIQFNRAKDRGLTKDPEVLKAFAVETVKDYPYSIRKIVDESCFSRSVLWNARRMSILPSFHDDKVVLAGDAAHPLLAFTSQGSNSALEDIACLMSLLSHQTDEQSIQEVFASYYKARKSSIEYYIKEGDELVHDFFNFGKSSEIKVPISLH